MLCIQGQTRGLTENGVKPLKVAFQNEQLQASVAYGMMLKHHRNNRFKLEINQV
jgi:hypothetical protein